MAYRKPRVIQYELAPRTQRQPLSIYKILFALIVGVFIFIAILFALYVVWYVYFRPHPPPVNYRHGEAVLERPHTTTARPTAQHRRHFEVYVTHHSKNRDRAEDVALYMNRTLREFLDPDIYASLSVIKTPAVVLRKQSDQPMTLEVELRETFPLGSTITAISELFPPTSQQLWTMVRAEHRVCAPLDEARCVEICRVSIRPSDVPNLTPADQEYEAINIRVQRLVDYAQNSAIYRQQDATTFSLTRWKKGCEHSIFFR